MDSNSIKYKLYIDETQTQVFLEEMEKLWILLKRHNTEWLFESQCLSLQEADNETFIFASFEGPAFERILKLNGQKRIVSAHLMLRSIESNMELTGILEKSFCVFSLAMSGVVACCTNKEEKRISSRIQMMGGFLENNVEPNVTHLITDDISSPQYRAAANYKIHVMLPQWVDQIWEDSKEKVVSACEQSYSLFKCPIFSKCFIFISGFSSTSRLTLKILIESMGGTCQSEFSPGITTHIVLDETDTSIYLDSKLSTIHIVKKSWIYDSIMKKYSLPEKDYSLDVLDRALTPAQIENTPTHLEFNDASEANSINNEPVASMNGTENDESAQSSNQPAKNTRTKKKSRRRGSIPPSYPEWADNEKVYFLHLVQNELKKSNKISERVVEELPDHSDLDYGPILNELNSLFSKSRNSRSAMMAFARLRENRTLNIAASTLKNEQIQMWREQTPLTVKRLTQPEPELSPRSTSPLINNRSPLDNHSLDNNFSDLLTTSSPKRQRTD